VHFEPTDWLDNNRKKLLKPSAVPIHFIDSPRDDLISQKRIEKKLKIERGGNCNKVKTKGLHVSSQDPNSSTSLVIGSGMILPKVSLLSLERTLIMKQNELKQRRECLKEKVSSLDKLLLLRDMELSEPQFSALDDQLY